MLTLKGKYNEAKVFTDNVDEVSQGQIIKLLSEEIFADRKIRIMPDVHAGAGCVIGFTMELSDKAVPNLVGVDIGCGVLTVKLRDKEIDLGKLDEVIRKHVPSGFTIHEKEDDKNRYIFSQLGGDQTIAEVDKERAIKSIGTLGGGNHFIEVGRDEQGYLYLFIHTGSRKFGLEIAKYHQNVAKEMNDRGELSYLTEQPLWDYLDDMKRAQRYASVNRKEIARAIINNMGLQTDSAFDTVHNYIDLEDRILRKGAVAAHKGTKIVIPLNMRDGVIVAIGKGNPDWNYTAPHGAGRLYSRGEAKRKFALEEFETEMSEVYSTSISQNTLDESPMAYKDMQEIISAIGDTVEIKTIVKPIYNFKA